MIGGFNIWYGIYKPRWLNIYNEKYNNNIRCGQIVEFVIDGVLKSGYVFSLKKYKEEDSEYYRYTIFNYDKTHLTVFELDQSDVFVTNDCDTIQDDILKEIIIMAHKYNESYNIRRTVELAMRTEVGKGNYVFTECVKYRRVSDNQILRYIDKLDNKSIRKVSVIENCHYVNKEGYVW